MESLANLFELDNVVLSYILGGVLSVISLAVTFLSFKLTSTGTKSDKKISLILAAVAVLVTAVASFTAYHTMILIASVLGTVAIASSFAKLNMAYNFDKHFDVTTLSLFFKYLIPISIFLLMFCPWFVSIEFYGEGNTAMYSWLAALGLKSVGIYAFSFDTFGILAILELLLFVGLCATQVYTIFTLFKNPDYCDSFNLFHLIITAVGSIFIYGIYTSNNFTLLEKMPAVSANADPICDTSMIYLMLIVLALLNQVLYFKKVDAFIKKISGKE